LRGWPRSLDAAHFLEHLTERRGGRSGAGRAPSATWDYVPPDQPPDVRHLAGSAVRISMPVFHVWEGWRGIWGAGRSWWVSRSSTGP